MRHYRVLAGDDPVVQRLEGKEVNLESRGYEEYNALVRFERSLPVEVVAYDGGEPEDNLFTRDWAWVANELNKVYHEGYAEGVKSAHYHTDWD